MRYKASFSAVLTFVCLMPVVSGILAAGPEEASAAVSEAEQKMFQAFAVVSEAEMSGANVSALLSRLNGAGTSLEEARVALTVGNFSAAASWASDCRLVSDSVKQEANILRENEIAASRLWWATVLFSISGAAVFVIVLVLVWRWFKRTYLERFMKSRPKVVE